MVDCGWPRNPLTIFEKNGQLETDKKAPECQCNVFSAGNEQKKHWNANASRFAKFFSGNVLSVAMWQSVRGNSWEQIFDWIFPGM